MKETNRTGTFIISFLALALIVLILQIAKQLFLETRPPETENLFVSPGSSEVITGKESFEISSTPALRARTLNESGSEHLKELNDQGLALYAQGDFEGASQLFTQALNESPSNSVLRQNLAFANGSLGWKLIESGDYQPAMKHFARALDLDANDPTIFTGIGLIYHRMNEPERAIEALEKAISEETAYPQPYKLLGEIYYLRDEMDLAVGYFEKAAELDPNDQNLRTRLSKAQREKNTQGDFQREATLHFTVKFEGREENSIAREVLSLLEEAYWEIGQSLSVYPEHSIPVILYSDQQFSDVTLTPDWSQGLFDGKIRLPISGFQKNFPLLRKVVYHEYSHAAVYELCKTQVPTWLNEGIALNLEGTNPDHWNRILLNRISEGRGLIPLNQLHQSFMSLKNDMAALAYAESYFATRYLIENYGMFTIKELLLTLSVNRSFETSFENHFFIPYADFETNWRSQAERDRGGKT